MAKNKLSRRDLLKISGLALGGLAVSGTTGQALAANVDAAHKLEPRASLESYPASGQMRITFCGSWYTPRPNQACNSVFVELGNDNNDSFVFDCGSGVVSRYVAMGVPYSRMAKIFLTHLHGDHMSDLMTIYCFGPASDRKFPLEVWGPSGDSSNEGTTAFCKNIEAAGKWHAESFSFLPTGYVHKPNGYTLIPHELRYMKNPGVAYDQGGVKITHFPAIHARDGSISYKLEWNGHSMVFTGDTKPNKFVLENCQNVDVLIHEMTTRPDVWTTKMSGLKPPDPAYYSLLKSNTEVIANSHTMETAFGYVMSKTNPRLAVATHFPNDPDLIQPAYDLIACHYKGDVLIAEDLRVITIDADGTIKQSWAMENAYPWPTGTGIDYDNLAPPKYKGPLAQFNQTLLDNIISIDDYACPGS
jgi:ribonuclease Z